MDADGLNNPNYMYQWIRVATDNTETNISEPTTTSTYTLVPADQGMTIKVTVSFTDDAGNAEELTSEATAAIGAADNTLATGAPTITGTAQVGQMLTADTTAIMDADGLTTTPTTCTSGSGWPLTTPRRTSPSRRQQAPTRWCRPTRA